MTTTYFFKQILLISKKLLTKTSKLLTKMKERIVNNLTKKFQPSFLQVIDNSSAHSGHFVSTNNLGTHFKVIITSIFFDKCTKIQAHRFINQSLKQEFLDGLHALEIKIIQKK